MDTINQIQALDSKRCSRNLIEVRVQILGPVKESKCGRLRLKNLSETTLFNCLKFKLVRWDVFNTFTINEKWAIIRRFRDTQTRNF